jgi:large repetitive protein
MPTPGLTQTFSQSLSFCSAFEQTAAVGLADIDADGDLDLLFGNGRHVPELNWLYSNDGFGNFYGRRALDTEPDRTYGVAFGDIDRDGDVDVVVANDRGDAAKVHLNDGKGVFRVAHWLGNGRDSRRAIALGDLDGDKDLDIVLVGPGQDHFYLNNGTAGWTEKPLAARQDYSLSVVVADMDGDGDLDIVVGNRNKQQNVIYLNDGAANFPETRNFGTGKDESVSVAVADIDHDNDPDIVVGNWEEVNAVYLNDGKANFAAGANFGTGKEQTWSVALGDVDLDGDLDIVAAHRGVTTIQVDGDGDGKPDRWVDQNRDEPGQVYLNDGRGRFTAASAFGTGNDKSRPIALGDVDGDGDLDIVIGNDCEPNTVFFNALRTRADKANK